MTYLYIRISSKKQSYERQLVNMTKIYPDAKIYKETFTGTSLDSRKEFNKLLKVVKEGDTIVFDSVSRMSRNAKEGFDLYKKLYESNISLVFIKEPHINTEVFKSALTNQLEMTGNDVDLILSGVNKYLMRLAERQIEIAFEQAEKEVLDLRQRTSEAVKLAQLNGKRVGNEKGSKLTTAKSIECKEKIKKHNIAFGGSLNDLETIELLGIARNTFYKYKKELLSCWRKMQNPLLSIITGNLLTYTRK